MHKIAIVLLSLTALFAVLSFVPLDFLDVTTTTQAVTEQSSKQLVLADPADELKEPVVDDRPVVRHQPLPEAVKAIYMTSCVSGTKSFRDRLIELIRVTEINSVMIDIKDYSGTISFPAASEEWQSAWQAAECGAPDMAGLIETLHEQGVYVIGRITVFQDPFFAPKNPELAVLRADQTTVWKDGKGLSFIDVASQSYWDHIIQLSIDAYNIGFDELNYDYVRYPSDGNMADTYYPQSMAGEFGMDKPANLEAFFAYLHQEMTNEERFAAVQHENTGREFAVPFTSADLFGMTTTNFDDLSIGQVQDRAAPYFDFIAPMVYPSHYPPNYLGLGDPNDFPYEVVHHAMQVGVDRMSASTTPMKGFLHTPITTTNASGTVNNTGMYTKPVFGPDKFRTWIQDFDYGGDYDAADVRAQIQASYDAGVDSWMIWAPSNIYTRTALFDAVE